MIRTSSKRDQNLRVQISKDEKRMVKRLAKAKGLNVSDYIRLLIYEKHDELKGKS